MKSVMLVLSILFIGVLSGLLQDESKDALIRHKGFPCGSAGEESACNVGDLGSVPGLGRSPGEGKSTHSRILAWKIPWNTVHGVEKSRT